MKKKILSIIFLLFLIFPIMIKAENVKYETAKSKANNYIKSSHFSDRKKYIDQRTNLPYILNDDGVLVQSNAFYRGGMLSKKEYELSQTESKTSYLTLGLKYWTLSPGTSGKQYYVENFLDQMSLDDSAGVRSTVFPLSTVYVVGKGTYNSPWEFKTFHTVKVTPKAYGSVDCYEQNCTKTNTTVIRDKIESGTDAYFKVIPNAGYKYLSNDSCNFKYITGTTYKIENVTRDLRCVVEFYPRTYTLMLKPGDGIEYRRGPSPDKIFLKYSVGTFSDPEAKTAIDHIEPPTRTGYRFKGYFYGTTKVIDEYGNIIPSQMKGITGFDLAGADVQNLVAQWEIYKVTVNYKLQSGETMLSPTTHNNGTVNTWTTNSENLIFKNGSLYKQQYDYNTVLTDNYLVDYNQKQYLFIKKKGSRAVEFQEWKCVGGDCTLNKKFDQKRAYNSQDICDSSERDCTAIFSVNWENCEAGTEYNSDDGTCDLCPKGTFSSTTSADSCIACAAGSYTNSIGSTSCTPCQPGGATGTNGTTNGTGQSSCGVSCNKAHVSTWKTQYWANNNTNPICEINSCATGYHLVDNSCVPNELVIIFNANGGSDLRASYSIPYTAVLKYDEANYSTSDGLPNYACTGNCFWRLAKTGYHGTSNWVVRGSNPVVKVNANTAFATNQALAQALGKLNDFQTKASTTVNLDAEWVECELGTANDGTISNTSCVSCSPGTFAAARKSSSCTACAVGSYNNETGSSSCTACQPSGATGTNGTTAGSGKTSCTNSCNKTNVATWKNQVWTNNNTNPLCEINTCSANYHLSGSGSSAVCVADSYTISYEYNGGSAPSSGAPTSYTYGVGATVNGTPTRSGYTFNGWSDNSSLTSPAFSKTIGTTATGDKKYWAKWCQNCASVTNGTCSLVATTAGTCTYNTTCNTNYHYSSGQSTRSPVCVADSYTISYEYNGGTAPSSGAPTSYTYGVGATVNGTPTRSGYTFNGWSDNSSLTSPAFSKTIGTTATGNKKYWAKWCENCGTVANGSCSLNASTAGTCTKTITCDSGYELNTSTNTCESTTITSRSAYVIALDSSNKIQCRVDFIYSYNTTTKAGTLDVTSVKFTHTTNNNFFYNNNVFFLGGGCNYWYTPPGGGSGWCSSRDYTKTIYFGSTKMRYWNRNNSKYEDYFNYDQGDSCIDNDPGTNSLSTCGASINAVTDFDEISITGNSNNKLDVKFVFSGVHTQGGSSISWNRTVIFNLVTGLQE